MKRRLQFMLVDETGHPLSPHIAEALISLVPRFSREFPLIRDQSLLTDFLEEAGRRIVKRERRSGPIEQLHGYAWVTLRSVARSWLRLGSSRLALHTLSSDASTTAFTAMAASRGGPEQIERSILRRQVLALMTRDERLICLQRELGFSSRQIAKLAGTSPGAVDTLLSRTNSRLRKLLGVQRPDARHDEGGDGSTRKRQNSKGRDRSDDGKLDDE